MNRASAIDLLRGIAILGMVFSGYIAWNGALPAWLFHAQVPPPAFAFDPSVPGITWVDLVFPFFLFSMGAAFPLSIGRKLDKGARPLPLAGAILKRGLLLAFFAIVLGNTSMAQLNLAAESHPVGNALLTLAVWGGFFALFIRLPQLSSRQNGWLNGAGAAVLVGIVALYAHMGVAVHLGQSDAIILILAHVVVAGSFIWWLTRRNVALRLGIVALLVALKLGADAAPDSWNAALWNASFAPWLYRTEYLQYLCIVLPGSVAGDFITSWLATRQPSERWLRPGRIYAATGLLVLLFGCNMWGLFARELAVNAVATAVLGGAAWYLLRRAESASEKLLYRLFTGGFFLLVLGLLFEAAEGGIKKDPATVSYFFVTSGLAALFLIVATVGLGLDKARSGLLIRCGQNPMVAYTAAGYVILPLLVIVNAVVPIPWLWGGCGCVMSVARGAVITALMLLFTAAFTRRKLFWKT